MERKHRLTLYILCILFCILSAVIPVTLKVSMAMNTYLSVEKLESIAGKDMRDGGGWLTSPVVTRKDSKLQYITFVYFLSLPGEPEQVSPPHRLIVLDPTNGAVLRDLPCTPKSLGVNKPADVWEESHVSMTWDDLARFKELSPLIWEAFDSGGTKFNVPTTTLIQEYYTLFKKIVAAPLLPYYHAVAPDFFKWLEAVTR